MGFGGIVGLYVGRGVDRGVCAKDDKTYLTFYLIVMVDMILVILMDHFVVQMMSNLCFHIIYESIKENDATLINCFRLA